MSTFKEFIHEVLHFTKLAFSENGDPSSKRILGALYLTTCLGIIVYLAVTRGDTEHVCNLVEMMIGVSGLLLGISSVTGIWKQPPTNNKNNTEK